MKKSSMRLDDYRPVAPTPEAEEIDSQVVARMRCKKCGGNMRYEPYTKGDSYIALAVCEKCGREVEI